MLFADLPAPEFRIQYLALAEIEDAATIPPSAELLASVKANGVAQPLVVTRNCTGYKVVDGLRRRRAAELAGLADVPVVIVASESDAVFPLLTLELNRLRSANPLAEVEAIAELEAKGYAIADICKRTGLKRGEVEQRLQLAALPEVIKDGLRSGRIRLSTAKAIAKQPLAHQRGLAGRATQGEKITGKTVAEIKTARKAEAVTQLQGLFATLPPVLPLITSPRARILAVLRSGAEDEAKADEILKLLGEAA